jgi:hypothetical protein
MARCATLAAICGGRPSRPIGVSPIAACPIRCRDSANNPAAIFIPQEDSGLVDADCGLVVLQRSLHNRCQVTYPGEAGLCDVVQAGHHAGLHVVGVVAVDHPRPGVVGGHVHLDGAHGGDEDGVLAWAVSTSGADLEGVSV